MKYNHILIKFNNQRNNQNKYKYNKMFNLIISNNSNSNNNNNNNKLYKRYLNKIKIINNNNNLYNRYLNKIKIINHNKYNTVIKIFFLIYNNLKKNKNPKQKKCQKILIQLSTYTMIFIVLISRHLRLSKFNNFNRFYKT